VVHLAPCGVRWTREMDHVPELGGSLVVPLKVAHDGLRTDRESGASRSESLSLLAGLRIPVMRIS